VGIVHGVFLLGIVRFFLFAVGILRFIWVNAGVLSWFALELMGGDRCASKLQAALGGATVHDETDASYYSRGLIELSCSCVGELIILIHAQCDVKDV
jgi:hypothetical protein